MSKATDDSLVQQHTVSIDGTSPPKRTFQQSLVASLKQPGSALQIIIAASTAIIIGLSISTTVTDIPEAVPIILEIPGDLWLRALQATILPLIITAIILAVQNLKSMAKDGAKLARWTIIFYISTTIFAVVHSMILVDLVWRPLMVNVDAETPELDEEQEAEVEESKENQPHDIVVKVFQSFIPKNIVSALAENELLSILVTAVVLGLLIRGPDSKSPLLRAVREIERIVSVVITILIKLSPIGVFSLIIANLLTLDAQDIGVNVGVLIGGSVCGMAVQMFIVYPSIFFAVVRINPYTYWLKNSPAWVMAWGTASSAATLPVTLRCVKARGVPDAVAKFTVPLGALINMDGTAIYFPMVVVFLAATQGQALTVGDYAIIVLLSVLSSIATTPIPSSSLVLTIMIANSVGIPITGMYAIVVAFDWLIDRFRTMTNVTGDTYAARVMQKVTGLTDDDLVVPMSNEETVKVEDPQPVGPEKV